MKLALGHKNLTPDAFWAMTIGEFRCLYEGYVESQGGGANKPGADEFLTRKELAALMEKYPDAARAATM